MAQHNFEWGEERRRSASAWTWSLMVGVEVVARRPCVGHSRERGSREDLVRVRHAVLHRPLWHRGPLGHPREPQIAHGDVFLRSSGHLHWIHRILRQNTDWGNRCGSLLNWIFNGRQNPESSLEGVNSVILLAHPVLLVHRETPAFLLSEKPLEEADGVLNMVDRLWQFYHNDFGSSQKRCVIVRASKEYGSFQNSNLEYYFIVIFEFRIYLNM